MQGKKDLLDNLRKLAASVNNTTPFMGKVVESSYDASTQTVDVEPLDGSAKLLGVLINANSSNGFLLVPKDNSVVGVIMTSNTTGYVALVSEVESIFLAGDANGGLIKIDNLKTQYDSFVNGIKAACAAGFTALSGLDGGASLSAFNASAAAILTLNKTTLENTTVQHGNG